MNVISFSYSNDYDDRVSTMRWGGYVSSLILVYGRLNHFALWCRVAVTHLDLQGQAFPSGGRLDLRA